MGPPPGSSLSPVATIRCAPSGSNRCGAFAFSHGVRIQASCSREWSGSQASPGRIRIVSCCHYDRMTHTTDKHTNSVRQDALSAPVVRSSSRCRIQTGSIPLTPEEEQKLAYAPHKLGRRPNL